MDTVEGQSDEFWDVVGDTIYCKTRLLDVLKLPKSEKYSKLWLDIKATVTVMVLPRDLEDEEELEDHYKVMLLEDDQMGQTTDVVEYEEKLEIDLLMGDNATKRTLDTITQELSKLIHVRSGNLLSAAATILRDARAVARDRSFVVINGADQGRTNPVLVHMEASISIDAVDDEPPVDVQPAFVPASKSSIEKLERVKVEASSQGVCCSICLAEIVVGSEALGMPCLHFYHEECIVEWLEKSRFCPLCRFSMPTDDHYSS
ncbi:uncharacterized protein [Pyrus communis]|uniref:uncharacterized protein n=1 Tax=Pyrus communis TaxID=23211 RepID=UPI0035C0B66D